MRRQAATLLFAMLFVLGPAVCRGVEVKDVQVRNRSDAPLDESSVRAYTRLAPGEELDRSVLSSDVKNLQKSGRFSFVEALVCNTAIQPPTRARDASVTPIRRL